MITIIFLSLNLAAAPESSVLKLRQSAIERKLKAYEIKNATDISLAMAQASLKYKLDYNLLIKIMMVESRGDVRAYNKHTKDYGVMQINKNTAKAFNIKNTCYFDAHCNIHAGAMILKDLQRYKNYRPCMYNLGPRALKGDRLKKCLAYEKKLDKFK